jgi:uncharacterized protein YgiM (DUF1202 family)
MKKLVFTFAIIAQSVFVFAGNQKETIVIRPKTDNVKMYLQAGTAAQILDSLETSDTVTLIRKFNDQWSIVEANGKIGYMLTSELVSEKASTPVVSARK